MPCSPTDVSIEIPTGPSGVTIHGFGIPFALKLPNPDISVKGFPENILSLFNLLQFLVPSGSMKAPASSNFMKDVFDFIMKLLDNFLPFLMLYKMILPLLKLVLCIIEVLCALSNPFKVIRALNKLFRECLPEFLNLFPIFAIIIMLISLLLLLLQLIEYIIAQVLKLINLILKNIKALHKAVAHAQGYVILSIASKLGSSLCIFQNLFVLLGLFAAIFQIIKDVLSLAFAIPPCDDSGGGENAVSNSSGIGGIEYTPPDERCCTADVCPQIVKTSYTNSTGVFKYINAAKVEIPGVVIPGGTYNITIRQETFQLYDINQTIPQQFSNIFDAYDVVLNSSGQKPVFFPTDSIYNNTTNPNQAPYTIDLRLFYNPQIFGRVKYIHTYDAFGHIISTTSYIDPLNQPRYIRFKNCIVTSVPSRILTMPDGTTQPIQSGVCVLAGGLGFEDDGKTPLVGYNDDGITHINGNPQATLETFIHIAPTKAIEATDGCVFNDVTYTFNPNIYVLFNKNVITAGCEPNFSFTRKFMSATIAGGISVRFNLLVNLLKTRANVQSQQSINASTNNTSAQPPSGGVGSGAAENANAEAIAAATAEANAASAAASAASAAASLGPNTGAWSQSQSTFGGNFPDPISAQDCITSALNILSTNFTEEAVAQFSTTVQLCLDTLKNDTLKTLNDLIGIAYDPYKSSFSLSPSTQFTTKPITVQVDLRESNNLPIANTLPIDLANKLAYRIKPTISFGEISQFNYDGYRYFEAQITSKSEGSGNIQVAFDNVMLSDINIPTDLTISPTNTVNSINYNFIYVPIGSPSITAVGDPSPEGVPRRNN